MPERPQRPRMRPSPPPAAHLIVWALWSADGTLLGLFSAEHWARAEAARDWKANRPSKARDLVWRTHPHDPSAALAIQPSTRRKATPTTEPADRPRLRYRTTREEVKP